ncbi:MAG: hypothetical protein RL318_754 [Fibrobacterota bacterium]|jgi:preprotein translocase subunit SecA
MRCAPLPIQAINDDFRLTDLNRRPKISKGLDALLSRTTGRFKGSRRKQRRILALAGRIDETSREYADWSQDRLQTELSHVRSAFRLRGEQSREALPKAMALIQESVQRTLGYRPYVVQLAGVLALQEGFIAEMSTGEGKTVTIAMAAVLRGWSGHPTHVITANDYLASRDAQIMAPLFQWCGVSVGSVTGEMQPRERKTGWSRDVTYTTAKEALADFLRDRIALGSQQGFQRRQIQSASGNPARAHQGIAMRGVHTAIVDEADNVLIDEAVTPLIISRQEPNAPFAQACRFAIGIASRLEKGIDYEPQETFRTIRFLRDIEDCIRDARQELGEHPFSGVFFQKDLVRQALVAREFFHRDRQYVVEEGKVVIVDESTGRKMPMRTWSAGLHQLVEAKEGLEMTPVQETQARLSFQRYFRFHRVFAGMTGTGKEAAGEFWHIYGVPVLTIPNHRPSRRRVLPLRLFRSHADKLDAILDEVATVHGTGRPVLIGTRNVHASEELAQRLAARGLACKVVNAIRQAEEAEVIAIAGRTGAITVATNMAGRGTDIHLPRDVEASGGLHVIASECHSSSRIDRQLFGRSARQGDQGSAVPFACMEDDLLRQNLPAPILGFSSLLLDLAPTLSRFLGPVLVGTAQWLAQRSDFKSRFQVQETDTWLDDSLSFSRDDVN